MQVRSAIYIGIVSTFYSSEVGLEVSTFYSSEVGLEVSTFYSSEVGLEVSTFFPLALKYQIQNKANMKILNQQEKYKHQQTGAKI